MATRRDAVGAMIGAIALLRATRRPRAPPAPAASSGSFSLRTGDGLTLFAMAYGDPASLEIVFVHGLGQSRLCWDRQTVAAMADRFRHVTYDLRGHGDSDKPPKSSSHADGALWGDDLQAVIEQAGLRRPFLVAWSMGGLVAGHYLARHGGRRLAGLNLVDAVTHFAPGLLSAASLDFGGRLTSPDLAVRSDAIAGFLSACFAKRPPAAAYDRILAYNAMVPRAVQFGVTGITTEGLDHALAAVPPPAHPRGPRRAGRCRNVAADARHQPLGAPLDLPRRGARAIRRRCAAIQS